MEHAISVIGREAAETVETPYGAVGTLYASRDLKAWWIWKDEEDVDPAWKVTSHDYFLYVVQLLAVSPGRQTTSEQPN
jgi:hypothetical protein